MKKSSAFNAIIIAAALGTVAVHAPALRAADTPERDKNADQTGKAGKLTITNDIVSYTPDFPSLTLAEGERLEFMVLVSPSGRTLDEAVARAGGDGVMTFSRLTKSAVSQMRLVDRKEQKLIGMFYEVCDTQGNIIKDKTIIQLDIKPPEAGATISAGIGVFDSKDPNYKFLRFVTSASTIKLPEGAEQSSAPGAPQWDLNDTTPRPDDMRGLLQLSGFTQKGKPTVSRWDARAIGEGVYVETHFEYTNSTTTQSLKLSVMDARTEFKLQSDLSETNVVALFAIAERVHPELEAALRAKHNAAQDKKYEPGPTKVRKKASAFAISGIIGELSFRINYAQ